jgi:hypothetical protein
MLKISIRIEQLLHLLLSINRLPINGLHVSIQKFIWWLQEISDSTANKISLRQPNALLRASYPQQCPT